MQLEKRKQRNQDARSAKSILAADSGRSKTGSWEGRTRRGSQLIKKRSRADQRGVHGWRQRMELSERLSCSQKKNQRKRGTTRRIDVRSRRGKNRTSKAVRKANGPSST